MSEMDTRTKRIISIGAAAVGAAAGAGVAAYMNAEELLIPSFTVRAAALNCGMYKLDPVREKMLIRCYLGSEILADSEKMDVLGHMTGAFPPSFIMTSTGDFLRPNAAPLGEHLTSLGVENEVYVYGEEHEPLGHVFHCDMRNPYAAACNEEECEFFRKHLV